MEHGATKEASVPNNETYLQDFPLSHIKRKNERNNTELLIAIYLHTKTCN
jgi:hypothetical protein